MAISKEIGSDGTLVNNEPLDLSDVIILIIYSECSTTSM